MKSSARDDIFLGLGVIALALIANFVIIPAGVSLPPKVPFKALEPAFWPNIIIYVLAFLGLVLVVQGLLASRGERATVQAVDSSNTDTKAKSSYPGITAIAIALLFVFNFLLNTVGFILASVVLLPVFMLLMGERRYWLIALIAVVLPFALHFFFRHVASVYVPLGFLEPWLG